jgi:hypothetical protein
VGHVGREEEDVPGANGDVVDLSLDEDAQDDVALELVEELFALVDVEVGARVGPAHHGDHEVAIGPDLRVAHGGLEQVAVLFDPTREVERLRHHRLLSGPR